MNLRGRMQEYYDKKIYTMNSKLETIRDLVEKGEERQRISKIAGVGIDVVAEVKELTVFEKLKELNIASVSESVKEIIEIKKECKTATSVIVRVLKKLKVIENEEEFNRAINKHIVKRIKEGVNAVTIRDETGMAWERIVKARNEIISEYIQEKKQVTGKDLEKKFKLSRGAGQRWITSYSGQKSASQEKEEKKEQEEARRREEVKNAIKRGFFDLNNQRFVLKKEYPYFYLFESTKNPNRKETISKSMPELPTQKLEDVRRWG